MTLAPASVKKTTRECWEIRSKGEWANISLAQWQRPHHSGQRDPYFGGELLIHSSYGNWAYSWNSCGVPFKEFLAQVEFDYLLTKLMGNSLHLFDGTSSLHHVKKAILSERRNNSLDGRQAKEAWDLVNDLDGPLGDQTGFCMGLQDIGSRLSDSHPMHDYFCDPMAWPIHTMINPSAENFWEKLWPHFLAALKEEHSEQQQESPQETAPTP